MGRYSDDGEAIVASWSTKADDVGDSIGSSRCRRAGAGVVIKPYTRSSVRVLVRTEHGFRPRGAVPDDRHLDFSELDFSRLSFSTAERRRRCPSTRA
jgi:hypothetical protein